MTKGKVARLAGFVGALGVSTVLVTTAVQGTGAYFTATQDGSLSGSTGQITIAADSDTTTTLSFDNLIPGEYVNKTIGYTVDGDANVDTWLVFQDNYAYCKFTGGNDDTHCSGGGMGRYGHFAVQDNDGTTLFSSYNLANADGATPQSECADAFGHGSAQPASDENDTSNRCGVPLAIKLQSNLSPGNQANVTLTFGVTGRQTAQNQAAPPASVPFQLVATQVNIRPDAPNF
jgi:hypothetical protein